MLAWLCECSRLVLTRWIKGCVPRPRLLTSVFFTVWELMLLRLILVLIVKRLKIFIINTSRLSKGWQNIWIKLRPRPRARDIPKLCLAEEDTLRGSSPHCHMYVPKLRGWLLTLRCRGL